MCLFQPTHPPTRSHHTACREGDQQGQLKIMVAFRDPPSPACLPPLSSLSSPPLSSAQPVVAAPSGIEAPTAPTAGAHNTTAITAAVSYTKHHIHAGAQEAWRSLEARLGQSQQQQQQKRAANKRGRYQGGGGNQPQQQQSQKQQPHGNGNNTNAQHHGQHHGQQYDAGRVYTPHVLAAINALDPAVLARVCDWSAMHTKGVAGATPSGDDAHVAGKPVACGVLVKVVRSTMYVGGRYRKVLRDISQVCVGGVLVVC